MRNILLNPGPVSLSEKVRRAAVAVDLCHREAEYFELQDRIRSRLLDIYGLDHAHWRAVLLGGSGTAAVEAMLSSLVARDGRLLIIENGVYGERMTRMARIHAVAHQSIELQWGALIDSAEVERILGQGEFSHLAMVHHETTTGRLNNLDEISQICSRHNVQLMVDGVSSFGAESIAFEGHGLCALAGTSNKCLHGIPGVAFVICRKDCLAQAVSPPRSLYLDLADYNRLQDQQSTPFTPMTNACLALDMALQELADEGGWRARRTHYRKRQQQIRRKLEQLDVEPLLSRKESSAVLRSFYLPRGMDYDTLHDRLKMHGFIIYAGQGGLANKLFRISAMGEITDYDMSRLEGALESSIRGARIGHLRSVED